MTMTAKYVTKGGCYTYKTYNNTQENIFCIPWLNEDGSEKDFDDLKESSKSWGGSDWDRYLEYLDSKERQQMRESLISLDRLDKMTLEKYQSVLSDIFEQEKYTTLRQHIIQLLDQLTKSQSEIIKARFWRNLKYKEIAKENGSSISSVRVQLKRGITKLHSLMTKKLGQGTSKNDPCHAALKKVF